MAFLDNLKRFRFRTDQPLDLKELNKQHKGKRVKVMEGEMVTIETIQPSVVRPTRYEINGKYHIVMLDFFKQMNKDKSITQDQIDAFDNIEYEIKRPKDVLDYTTSKEVH